MIVLCSILVTVNVGFAVITKADVEGKVVGSNETHYMVDFREGLKKYPKVIEPENYSKIIVNKQECIRE